MTPEVRERIVVVAPTYDEIDNIEIFLRGVRHWLPNAEILVVDDASPDRTAHRARAVGEILGGIQVLERPAKIGLGSAYREGFAQVLASTRAEPSDASAPVTPRPGAGAEGEMVIVVSMDVDASHDPADLPRLVDAVRQGADLAIGSRYVPGGGTRNWGWHRRWLSRWGNRYAAAMLGTRVRDATSGYRAYRAATLSTIDITSTTAEGYAFLTEVVMGCASRGLNIVEVPIVFTDRIRGRSKMSGRIILESMLLVTRWGLARRWRRMRSHSAEQAPGGVS